MKNVKWIFILLFALWGCSRSTPDPALNTDTSAMLNEQAWGGFASTWRYNDTSDPCGGNTINLTIQNKLPYPKARLQAPALCSGYCGDQVLTFTRIPMSAGTYTLSTHQPCSANSNQVGVAFTTLIGGDVVRDQYQLDSTRAGTINITRYDLQRGEIEGTFDAYLIRDNTRQLTSDAAETVHFRNGIFKAKLP